jgi:hypothetical protein
MDIMYNSVKMYISRVLFALRVKYLFFENKIIQSLFLFLSKIKTIDPKAEVLNPTEVKIRSDTVFVMGSGYSINDISDKHWKQMIDFGEFLSFNNFFRGKFIPIDFHIVREIESFYSIFKSKSVTEKYVKELFGNPFYQKTLFFILNDKKSLASTWVTFFFKIFKDRRICFYKNLDDRLLVRSPSNNINKIPHCGTTLFDAINIAYILGYKKIVLVGVDLYDRRYFWLGKDETRYVDKKLGSTHEETHSTANLVMEVMVSWKEYLNDKGIEIYVFNERSLLSKILPIYDEIA